MNLFRICILIVTLCSGYPGQSHASDPVKSKEQKEREEREKRERDLFGNLGSLAPSQQQIGQVAALGNRNASTLSKLVGLNSIRNGVRHIRHGRLIQARPEIRLGYFEVLQGILGLYAARTASSISSKDDDNAVRLVSMNGQAGGAGAASGNSASSSSREDSKIALTNSSWSELRAELARDAEASKAFAEIEEEYGIKQSALFDDLQAGQDGRRLLVDAEKNAETPEDATESFKEMRAGIASNAEAHLLEASASSAPIAVPTPELASPGKVPTKPRGLRDRLGRSLASIDDGAAQLALSPEVQKALEDQEREELNRRAREARASRELTLFDIVHDKYREREAHIRGWIKPAVLEAGGS